MHPANPVTVHIQRGTGATQDVGLPNRSSLAADAAAVLTFWFELEPATWFRRDDAVDAVIRQRFTHLVDQALRGGLDAWSATPEGTLALILVLDQFPRNLHRGHAEAFCGDARAQMLTSLGVARGDDRRLGLTQRLFFVLPWEHAESLELQDKMVRYVTDLHAEAPESERKIMATYLDYAERHRTVIKDFGRFPHRNAALKRSSSAAELAYLAQPGSGF